MENEVAPAPLAIWQLDTRRLARRVHVYASLASTNTFALSFGNDPARHGLAVLARTQSAGRGQHGRTWQAPPDSSVLLSLVLFAPEALRRPALLTAWAAVSVCETIRDLTGAEATIKWPNDVLIDGKKVCGILSEQRNSGDPAAPLATVVGIGLNVAQRADFFVNAELPGGASIATSTGRLLSTETVARRLLQQLDDEYDRLVNGEVAPLETGWRNRLGMLGEQVFVEGISQNYRGRLRSLNLAELELEVAPAEVVRLAPETVRHLTFAHPDA